MHLATERRRANSIQDSFSLLGPPSTAHVYVQRLFDLALHNGTEGLWELHPVTGKLFMSPRFKAQLGFAPDELANTHAAFNDLVHEEDRAGVQEHVDRCLGAMDKVFCWTFRVVNKHGHVHRFIAWAQAMFSAEHRGVRVLGLSRDITTHPVEARTPSRAELYRHMLDDFGLVLAQSLDVNDLMNACTQLLRVPALADWCMVTLDLSWCAELPGRADSRAAADAGGRLSPAHPDRLAQALSPLAREGSLEALWRRAVPSGGASGQSWLGEVDRPAFARMQNEHPDLDRLAQAGLQSVLQVPMTGHGQRVGTLTMVRSEGHFDDDDLAAVKLLANRAALAMSNAKLYALRAVTAHSANNDLALVAHDLRNPLTAIVLRCERMLRKLARGQNGTAEQTLDFARDIERYAERMQRLIHTILDQVKMQDGRVQLDRTSTPVTLLVDELKWVIAPLAHAKGVALNWSVDDDLGLVLCDSDLMLQVFSNLADNALHFSRRGQCVTVRVIGHSRHVHFAVADEGPGIQAQHVAHLFERLWQGPDAAPGGSGLGLYMARSIVEAHGGHIAFSFNLPRELNVAPNA